MSHSPIVLDGSAGCSTLSVLSSSLRCDEEIELIQQELVSFKNSGCPIAENILSHLNIDSLSRSWSRFKDEIGLPLKPKLGRHQKQQASKVGKPPIPKRSNIATKRETVHETCFSAAFSYSGEERDYISQVVYFLEETLGENEIFYDRKYAADMACASLDKALFKIYSENANFIIACLSQGYEKSKWCQLEWNIIRSYINDSNKRDRVMLLRFDDHQITCLPPTEGYIDARLFQPKEISDMILSQMNRLGLKPVPELAHGMN